MQILVTTTNPHKLEEIRSVFAGEPGAAGLAWPDFSAVCRERGDAVTEPVEDQPTFEGNATLKARHYARQTGMICLADDSGLEVDALGGAPGVRSARYSGIAGPRGVVDPANNKKLLAELDGVPAEKRGARFVCAMCLHIPAAIYSEVSDHATNGSDPTQALELVVRGGVEGRILLPREAEDPEQPHRGRGANGFGYDPLFVLPDDHPDHPGLTTAQLTDSQKNAISHRGHAARRLLVKMRETGLIG